MIKVFGNYDDYWDGFYKSKQTPVGMYPYKLTYSGVDAQGNPIKGDETGSVLLMR